MLKPFRVAGLLVAAMLLLPTFGAKDSRPIKIPKKVNAIIQAKCYGCHSNDGNQRPKDKLNWDALNGLSAEQQRAKLESILSVLQEGSMPPARFLEKNADKKLTEKETARLKKWATKAARKL